MSSCEQASFHSLNDCNGLSNATIAGQSFAVPFEIRIESPTTINPGLREMLVDRLPYGSTLSEDAPSDATRFRFICPTGSRGYRTFAGGDLTGEFNREGSALEQIARDLMIHVANFAPAHIFLHAGVVAINGRGLMLPGTSFAGKTTLVAALVRAGALYYSDEYAVINDVGAVFPYSRNLQMRPPGQQQQYSVPVTHLRGVAGTEPIRVHSVFFASYEPGAHWEPRPVSPGMAVLEMLRHTIPVQRTPGRVMSALNAVIAGATAWRSARGDCAETVPALIAALKGDDDLSGTKLH